MWREGKWCTTSRGDSSVQGIAGREGKNIPKNVRSKIFIKLFGFWKLLDNVLSKVFGASCANKQRFLTLRSPARPPIERCFWSRRKRKTTEILVLIGDQNAFEALLSRSWWYWFHKSNFRRIVRTLSNFTENCFYGTAIQRRITKNHHDRFPTRSNKKR